MPFYDKKVWLCHMLVSFTVHVYCASTDTLAKDEWLDKNQTFQTKGQGQRQRRNEVDSNITSLLGSLPDSWLQMCSVQFKLVSGSNFTSQRAVLVSCDLDEHDYWSLNEYRKWISTNEKQVYNNLPISEGLLFAFEFKCLSKTAEVSLPWPVRAKYIWNISVKNCTIVDYLSEYNVELNITDTLNVVEFVNSEILINSELYFHYMYNYENVSKQFDCGGLQMQKYVQRNCTFKFTESSDGGDDLTFLENTDSDKYNSTASPAIHNLPNVDHQDTGTTISYIPDEEQEMLDTIAEFGQKEQLVHHKCSYDNLLYIDESYSSSVTRNHGHFMKVRFLYPALQFYNMSHSRLRQLPPMLFEWRRYFPRMQYLDMSFNKIKYFSMLSDQGLKNSSVGVFDLQHNNITTLTSEDLETLRMHSNTVFIDIRHNPLNCDCKLTHLVMQIRNISSEVVKKYEYLKHMECSSPKQFHGMTISQLEVDFCETAELVILATPMAILSTFVVVLLLVMVVMFRCRQEIMILAFTRLHVSLPCRTLVNDEDKIYDAFVAYSEHDAKWVIDTLLPRLELPVENNGPGLKLCIHHRDFPIGGSIADNILEKVKDSRHTVLILSNHFLASNWCKYEFKTAFSQSLMEKKRHLIMIIKEELDKHLIDTDLNRCLKTFTYVKADDILFWDKIVYALSNSIKKKRDKNNGQAVNEEDVNQNHVQVIEMKEDQNERNDNINANNILEQREGNNIEINRMFVNQGIIQECVWNI